MSNRIKCTVASSTLDAVLNQFYGVKEQKKDIETPLRVEVGDEIVIPFEDIKDIQIQMNFII